MENASKALLIAGGVLLSILILGALTLMWNQLSSIGNSNQDATEIEQIAEFNQSYLSYAKEEVRGSQLISLINKAIDYNNINSDPTEKSFQKIEIKIDFKRTNAFGGRLFRNRIYTESDIGNAIDTPRSYEQMYTLTTMSALVSYINSLPNANNPSTEEQEQYNSLVTKLTGRNAIPYNEVLDYSEYTEFKRANFKCDKVEYNKGTGRIIKMEFTKID